MRNKQLEITPEISIHFSDSGPSDKPAMLMLHSLSDNRHAFDAVVAAGLDLHFRIIAPDLRGRGSSSKPAMGYGLEDHCHDLIALLDSLGIQKAVVVGHSFGGYLALYFASHYPQRSSGLTLIDTATEMNPLTPGFVQLLTDRLGKWYPDETTYVLKMRAAPFVRYWDDDLRRCFLADTQVLSDGSLIVNTQKLHIAQCEAAIQAVSKKEWRTWAMRVKGPALVLWAQEPFVQGQHIVSERHALETAVLLPKGESHQVPGNHLTMLVGQGAKAIASYIVAGFSRARIGAHAAGVRQ